MKTLAERIRWVLVHDLVENARQWSIAAGLTPQHVHTFLKRAELNAAADMERGTVEALATAARVAPAWLLTGEGMAPLKSTLAPEQQVTRDDRYANRASVHAKALATGWYAPEALRRLLAVRLQSATDLEEDEWKDMLDGFQRDVKRGVMAPDALPLGVTDITNRRDV